MKKLKPAKLNKMSKKELRKVYKHIWRLNLTLAGQNQRWEDICEKIYDKYEGYLRIQDNAILNKDGTIQSLEIVWNAIREELQDTQEALRRSRNLRHTFQEYAERTNKEVLTIEEMAENLFDLFKLGFVKREWEFGDLSEDDRDWFRANATAIISNPKNYVQEKATENRDDWASSCEDWEPCTCDSLTCNKSGGVRE